MFSILLITEHFLAHLSRRLTRWAHSIPLVRRRRPSIIHTFKLEYLWSQLANHDQILCVASRGWGKGCIWLWGRLDQNSGFYGSREPLLTFNGENNVSSFSWLVFDPILFILAGNEDMHKISDKFEVRPDRTTDYGVSCAWASKTCPIDLQGENAVSMLVHSFLIESSSKLLVTRTGIKARTSFDFGPDQTTQFGVTCPRMTKILHFWTWISLTGQSWSNFMCTL